MVSLTITKSKKHNPTHYSNASSDISYHIQSTGILHAVVVVGDDNTLLFRNNTIVLDLGELLDDGSSEQITADVDGGSEAVNEPIDGNNDGVHASNLDVDAGGNHDGKDKRGAGDRRGSDRSKSREQDNDDIIGAAKLVALSGGKEDDDSGEVNGSTGDTS